MRAAAETWWPVNGSVTLPARSSSSATLTRSTPRSSTCSEARSVSFVSPPPTSSATPPRTGASRTCSNPGSSVRPGSGIPRGMSRVGFAASSSNSVSPSRSKASTGAVYSTVDVPGSPVETTRRVGWSTTRTVKPSGVPFKISSRAARIVEIDSTALRSLPGMSVSRTTDRVDSVCGALTSDPVPSVSFPPPDSRPPRWASGPGRSDSAARARSPSSRPLSPPGTSPPGTSPPGTSPLGTSPSGTPSPPRVPVSPPSSAPDSRWVSGMVGIASTRDRWAAEVEESAMVPTHGPVVGLQRAWARPFSPLIPTSGLSGASKPVVTGSSLSGNAVCVTAPGTVGAWPPTASPNGEASATARS